MTNFKNTIEVVITKSFVFGSLNKGTYYTGTIGDKFTAIGETKTYYITDNIKNNKLPKWATN